MSDGPKAKVVAVAREWIGTPYRHQASTRGAGTDCLGLILGVWREVVGPQPEAPPPYTPGWGETEGAEVLLQAALRHLLPRSGAPEPGDVLLFRMRAGGIAKHLGIMAEGGRFVHAYVRHGVVESALTEPWARRVAGVFEFPVGRK